MGATPLKVALWFLPWIVLISVLSYGFQQSENAEYFLLGNTPLMFQEFSKIEFSEENFGVRSVNVIGKSLTVEFYFQSPFPFPIEIKDVLARGEANGKEFELRLEKEVTLKPYENSTITLSGELPFFIPETNVGLKEVRITLKIFGIEVEIEG